MTSRPSRFASVSEEEQLEILDNRHASNTHVANKQAVKIFKDLIAHKISKDAEKWWMKVGMTGMSFEKLICSTKELDHAQNMFLRQQNGEFYKLTSFYSIRYSINRHICETRVKLGEAEVSILDNKLFPKSNTMFKAMAKKLKVEGRGGIESHPPIEEEDLAKIRKYFTENIEKNATTLQEKVKKITMSHHKMNECFGTLNNEYTHIYLRIFF